MVKGKFVKLILGPLHSRTRAIPFLEEYKGSLHNYILVTDYGDTYKNYNTELKVIDVNTYRKDHPWSLQKEVLYEEKDEVQFAKGWHAFTEKFKGNLYPLDFMRFGFLEGVKEGYTKLCFASSPVYLTKKQHKIDNYFDSLPPGIFVTNIYEEYADYFAYEFIKEEIHRAYPRLTITGKYLYFDAPYFTMSFKSKEDGLLFCEMWDKVLEIIYNNKEKNLLKTDAGYTEYEAVIGLVMRIFCDNFGYENVSSEKYWEKNTFGTNVCMVHDTFQYHAGTETRLFHQYGFHRKEDTYTVEEFISINKDKLAEYYSNYGNIDFEIKKDNVLIKFKDSD